MFSKSQNIQGSQNTLNLYKEACNCKAKGDFTNAIKLFKEALKINPNYMDALNNLGNVYSGMEEYNEAMYYLTKANQVDSDNPIILNNLSICLMELDRLEEAKIGFERAIELKRDFYQAYDNLGKLYSLKRDLISAKKCYEKALEINPSYQRAKIRLDSINYLLEDYPKAEFEALLSEILKEKKVINQDLDAIMRKARMYDLNGETGEAIFFYNQALKINPQSVPALSGLSGVYLHSGEYKKCIDYAQKALATYSKHKESYFNIGAAGFYLDNFSLSVENLNKFLSLVENEEDSIDGNYIIGLAYYGLGDYNKSIYHLKKTTESDNNSNGSVFYAIANSFIALGDENNGLLYMKKAESLGDEYGKKIF